MAPRLGAKEVGCLLQPTAAGPAADLSRVSSADPADGAGVSGLGLLSDPWRTAHEVGHRVDATTIRSVLLATGVPPYGQRSQLTWKQFLAAHAETLAAADFFSVDTIFFKRLYVLIYVHLASRRVWGSINTSNSSPAHISGRSPRTDRIPGRVIGSLFYSLLRVLLDALATKYGRHAELQAEVLALRRQVQVLERQIKRVHWSPGDRMVLAALRDRIPRSGWAGLLVKPETVLGWHRVKGGKSRSGSSIPRRALP